MDSVEAQVAQLYVALFGRAPDSEGLAYWSGLLTSGQSVAQVADTMFGTTPARAYFPDGASDSQVIASFYLNVLGRSGDAGGLAYWTDKLGVAGATRGSVLAEMVNVVANYTGNDPAGLTSAALFNNRAAAALFYGENGGSIANGTQVLAGVTTDAQTVLAARVLGTHPAGGVVDVGGYSDITIDWLTADLTLLHVADGATLHLTQNPNSTTIDVRHFDVAGVANTLTVSLPGTIAENDVVLKLDTFDRLEVVAPETGIQVSDNLALGGPRLASIAVAGSASVFMSNFLGNAVNATLIDASAEDGAVGAMLGAGSHLVGDGDAEFLVGLGTGGTVEGGAGNDVVRAFGSTTLVGGAGSDAFQVALFDGLGTPVIADFELGFDDIAFGLMLKSYGAWYSQQTAVTGAATLAVCLDLAATRQPGSQYSAISWFQYGGDTYVVVDNSTTLSTFQFGVDGVVKIVGLVDLSTVPYDATNAVLG